MQSGWRRFGKESVVLLTTTDSARSRGKGVGGAEEDATSLDGLETLPDHGDDGAAVHVYQQVSEHPSS